MSLPSPDAHDEADHGGAGATDVEGRHPTGALDLVVARRPRDLLGGVEQHAHAGGAHGVTEADEPAAGVDGQLAVEVDDALLDGPPRLARCGEAEVVEGGVLG